MKNPKHSVIYSVMQVNQSWWDAKEPNRRAWQCFSGSECSGSQTRITCELLLERNPCVGLGSFCYLFLFLSLSSLQERAHCAFSNKNLPSENELEICQHCMDLEETLISTAVNFGTFDGIKLIGLEGNMINLSKL